MSKKEVLTVVGDLQIELASFKKLALSGAAVPKTVNINGNNYRLCASCKSHLVNRICQRHRFVLKPCSAANVLTLGLSLVVGPAL